MMDLKVGPNKNLGAWSDIVAAILREINSWETILENAFSVWVFEWLVILVCFKIYSLKGFEARESIDGGHCSLVNYD